MSKKTVVQSATEEVKAPELAAPAVENKLPDAPVTPAAAPGKQAATAAAVKKAAAKPKAVAEKATPAPKTPAKPAKKPPVAAKGKPAEAAKPEKAEKSPKAKKPAVKKPKLIRDSFTIPEVDYALFAAIKQRALGAGIEVKKAEILRAALAALAKLDDAELAKAIGLVERIKTGRPKK